MDSTEQTLTWASLATMKDDLQNLAKDACFQAQLEERGFQIYLHEDIPVYWEFQFDLLVAIKSVFDRFKPREATVVFPNRTLRYPTPEMEVLLKLTTIQDVCEGLRIWVEYLVQEERVRLAGAEWKFAFKRTEQGYRIELSDTCTARWRQSLSTKTIADEMTETVEKVFPLSIPGTANGMLKEEIRQKARALLTRYMDPVPLAFAIRNYESLMKTSYEAGKGIRTVNIALQGMLDAEESFTRGAHSWVKILIVKGVIPQIYANRLIKASEDVHNCIQDCTRRSRKVNSYGIIFAFLPGTGPGNEWRTLNSNGEIFCDHMQLPLDIISHASRAQFMRELLLGSRIGNNS